MRRFAVLGLVGLCFGMVSGLASASQPDESGKFDLFCRFQGDEQKDKDAQSCRAVAHVIIPDRARISTEPMKNFLGIKCGDDVLYKGEMIIHQEDDHIVLHSLPGPKPEIILPKGSLHNSDDGSVASAWLVTGDDVLQGFCHVKTCDDDHEPNPAPTITPQPMP